MDLKSKYGYEFLIKLDNRVEMIINQTSVRSINNDMSVQSYTFVTEKLCKVVI